uniref:Integral membrane protein n=1 Tax=Parastrongyloides trichosuri TaxID=131310 RepID=A0A0N4ZUX6_PARTI
MACSNFICILFFTTIFASIILSIFALIHNHWYTIAIAEHPIGLFGGCLPRSHLDVNKLFNLENDKENFCLNYRKEKPFWMKKSLVIMSLTIILKIFLFLLTIIRKILSSSNSRSYGSIIMVLFIISVGIKFFNLCIIKFGRKQLYTHYNYTEKSTCIHGCFERFDDGYPFLKLGNSYYFEIISILVLITSSIFFLLYVYQKREQRRSVKINKSLNQSIISGDSTKVSGDEEFLIQENTVH